MRPDFFHPTALLTRWLSIALACGHAVALSARTTGAPISSLSEDALAKIRFDQKLGEPVTMDLRFLDEEGRSIRLGDCLGDKPAILILGYYRCPMLCNLVLNGLVIGLKEVKFTAGQQFNVIMVSIDPKESSEIAAAKKRNYLARYGRDNTAQGWHFLTGDEAAISQLAREVGYHYAYDPSINEYAHPSGLVILTPQGRVAQYFFGVSYPPRDLASSLQRAGAHEIGSPVQQILLLCFHYNPLHGPYGHVVLSLLRWLGVLTVLCVVGMILFAKQRHPPLPPLVPVTAADQSPLPPTAGGGDPGPNLGIQPTSLDACDQDGGAPSVRNAGTGPPQPRKGGS
jgi:protein SCO1